ncbi:CapA family protein [Dysgonomonas sp. 521]|uniref:CapA family protein n=1 Tax=Dysgonomonas sp. 521 TaxID=2302932 RepID=UPI0013D3F06E|nr:CapA family protein [Dysgonomonas sp. 521]NDV95641.1 CapA family protein [Dysgonomonas sp. 521]
MLREILHIIILAWCILLCNSCKQEKYQDEHLTICFTGDVLLDRGVREQIGKKGIEFLFEDVAPVFKNADATVINLECPVTKTISPINKKYIFRAEPEWFPTLKENGITHAALANNHSMDQGRSGLEDTYRHLSEAGIVPIGYGKNAREASKPVFIAKDESCVAIFNAVTLPLENWVYLEDRPGINQTSIETLVTQIKELKTGKPDFYIVVILHWGIEFQKEPTIKQRKEAYQLIDAGADVIIGHHPHILQKEEIYKEKPIFYSLGNFVFDQSMPAAKESTIIQINFEKDGFSFEKYPVKINNCKPELQ